MNHAQKELEKFAIQVVRQLREHGYEAYFAGGCVRDKMLQVPPKDYDVATSARPDDVRQVFGRRRTFAIGESFGVITVVGPHRGGQVEVATFRSDGPYSDGRRPDTVAYSSAKEDAARRDFTINGMFLDPLTDEVIDYVDGQTDLALKRVRAIGDPQARFAEDRLRMLRAIRFAASYELDIDPGTFAAVRAQCTKIDCVSQERITSELGRMFRNEHRCRAFALLLTSGLLEQVLPRAAKLAESETARWARLMLVMDALQDPSDALWVAALCGPDGLRLSVADVAAGCRRLRVSNDVRTGASWLVANRARLARSAELKFSELQPLLVSDHFENGISYLKAVSRVDGEESVSRSIARCLAIRELPRETWDPPPLLRGDDLTHLGIPPGPIYKQILQRVRAAQLDEEIASRESALTLAQQLADASRD